MQKMAYYDEISGLPNQRYLEEKLEHELLVAEKEKGYFTNRSRTA